MYIVTEVSQGDDKFDQARSKVEWLISQYVIPSLSGHFLFPSNF